MSFIVNERITIKPFAGIPPLKVPPGPSSADILSIDLTGILRGTPSHSQAGSSRRGIQGGVDLAEGCLVTKTIRYTHQLAHWVSAVRKDVSVRSTVVRTSICVDSCIC